MYNKLVLMTLLTCCFATPPPGYVKPPETDEFPPKYEYGYNIEDNKGSGQGKSETRDGVFSSGRYYVQLRGGPKGASQNVQYFTDEWGYHPVVEYSSTGDHSQTSTQFALGEKAVEALKKNIANQSPLNEKIKQIPQTTNHPTSVTPLPSPPPQIAQNIKPVIEVQQPETIIVTLDTNNQNPKKPLSSLIKNIPAASLQQSVPTIQNVIPLHYLIQPQNIHQAKYLIQTQNDRQNMPQAQFLIQTHNAKPPLPHPQFLVPVYHTQSSTNVNNKARLLQNNVNRLNSNIPSSQIIVEQMRNIANQNIKTGIQNENIQTEEINTTVENETSVEIQKETANIEGDLNEAIKYETEKVLTSEQENGFNLQTNNQQYKENIDTQKYIQKDVVLNSNIANNEQYSEVKSESHNNGQYLVEVTQQPISENNPQRLNQNVITLSQNEQNNNAIGQNNQHIVDNSATEIIKQQNNVQVEYLTQDIAEDNYKNNIDIFTNQNVKLQNTEALFGNTVNEVKYNTGSNYKESQNLRENPNYDETILYLENPGYGGYGSRINVKNSHPVKNNKDISATLIDRTKNLVTGVDVLNINDAISNTVTVANVDEQKINFDENRNILSEYENVQYANNYPFSISDINSYLFSNINTNNNKDSESSQVQTVSKTVLIPKVATAESNIQSSEILPGVHNSQTLHSENTKELQNTRSKLLQILNAEKIIPAQEENEHVSLADKPIIVADLEHFQQNSLQSTTENYQQQTRIAETVFSTTQNTIETKIVGNSYESTDSPVLITPRPVSNTFLAPITAAVNLQNSKQDLEVTKTENITPETYIEIQKSVPYYIGKVEYLENEKGVPNNPDIQFLTPQQIESLKSANIFATNINSPSSQLQQTLKENVSQEPNIQSEEHSLNNSAKTEALLQSTVNQNSIHIQDQVQEQGQLQQKITAPLGAEKQLLNLPQNGEDNLEVVKKVSEISSESLDEDFTDILNKPIEVTKYTEKPYLVEVKVPVPLAIEKEVPIVVEKIVEKPVEVTKVVEKQVPVHIPQPYPVEVEKIVEKQIKVPVEITRYVDKPYPVHIPYPQPVAVPVEVERIVETVVKEPYPVKIPIPVEVPVKIPVPQPVQVTKYIEKPVPVEKIIEKPIPIEKIVEKPVPQYIEKPYPVPVHVAVPHPIAVPVEVKIPQPYPVEVTKYIEKPYGVPQPYAVSKSIPYVQHIPVAVPVTKLVQVPFEVPKYIDRIVDRPYPIYINVQGQQKLGQSPYLYAPQYQLQWKHVNCDPNQKKQGPHFAKTLEYIGLVPPLKPATDFNSGHQGYKRKARNSFGQNLRIEYGFKPPIIPSVQTDEFGMPLNKEDQK